MQQQAFFLFFVFISIFLSTDLYALNLELTQEEQAWLADHPVIRIAYDNKFPPYEWKNDQGIYQGISIDYIGLIEKQLNICFQQVDNKTWSEMLKNFKAGKIDVLSAIAENDKRLEFILFTRPHISIPGVIISAQKYDSIEQLKGKKVGVVSDNFWDDLLSQYEDEIQIARVDSTKLGIELTAMGAIDAMVSDLASVTYRIHKDSISNLQIVPVPGDKKKTLELAIGIRKDWPQLQLIIQKALDSISQQEKEGIYNKWIKLQEVSFLQDKRFQIKALIISLLIISVFILFIAWNRSLKLQVARRSKQLENARVQLIRAEKMESIGRLSAGVAHEVKNPLAIMQMSIDYLKGEENDETVTAILNDMDDAVLRADTVIKGLLDFSREKELQVVKGNINEVIERTLKLINHELKQRNIEIKTSLAEDLPSLGLDKNRLQQVFINLFMNAAQAISSSDGVNSPSRNKGEINISSSLSEINDPDIIKNSEGRFCSGQQVVLISIKDTGCGLNQKDEKNVFEPFFTTKPVGEGTGLGLSVSKTIIGLHNGMITMKNRTDGIKGVEIQMLFALKGDNND